MCYHKLNFVSHSVTQMDSQTIENIPLNYQLLQSIGKLTGCTEGTFGLGYA